MKKWLIISGLALLLTYLSLFKAGQATVTRQDIMGCEQSCQVVAAGFPLPFMLDGSVTSPVNSISIDPFTLIFLHDDEFHSQNFIITYGFWLLVAWVFYWLFSRKIKHPMIYVNHQ